MTSIVIAARDGILKGPDGEQYRMVRGRTLANAAHPAVAAYPDNWQPMVLDIDVPDPEEADPGHLEDDVAVELAELREEARRAEADAARYQEQLQAIAEGLESRGLIPPSADIDRQGWLIDTLFNFIDTALGADGHTMDGQLESVPDDVPPPAPARKRATPKAGT